jgi:peroxin-16
MVLVFAAINLLGLYHDALIVRALATRQHRIADDALTTDLTDRSTIDPSIHLHNRYIRTFWSTDKIYRSISLALTVIKATEVTIEMLALRRLSEEGRWRLVMKIEILKALLRFILLKRSGNRRLISPPHPLREVDPAMVEDAVSEVSNHVSMINGTTPTRHTWTGQRSGKDIAQLATVMTHRTGPKKQEFSISDLLGGGRESNDSVTEYILSKTLRPEDVLSGHYLVRVQHGWHLLGEWLYILRPVIYGR